MCANCGFPENEHCNYCGCCEPDSQECPSWCDKPIKEKAKYGYVE
jgi:hypothetical protein